MNTIVKANKLIEARYSLSLSEQRIILACIASHDSRQAVPETIELTAEELVNLYGMKASNAYAALEDAKELLGKKVELTNNDDIEEAVTWISHYKHYKRQGRIRLSFAPPMRTYLGSLHSRFTQYPLDRIANLKSVQSLRLYELLMQFKSTGEREVTLEKLKAMLGIEEGLYTRFDLFKSKVLNKAVKELEAKSNLKITYLLKRKARKVHSIAFSFKEKDQLSLEV